MEPKLSGRLQIQYNWELTDSLGLVRTVEDIVVVMIGLNCDAME
jgi:hypothetical protein